MIKRTMRNIRYIGISALLCAALVGGMLLVCSCSLGGDLDTWRKKAIEANSTGPASSGLPVEMVWVPGGSFQMGNPNSSVGFNNERPMHTVTLSGFYIGKYEVTQAQYQAVMGTNPSYFTGNNLPVECVRWYDAVVFCNKLSIMEELTPAYRINGSTNPATWGAVPMVNTHPIWDAVTIDSGSTGYRLPTEAQWEYAAKGGNGSPGNYTYAGSNEPDEVAWYGGNVGDDSTKPVGTKAANGLGLYDMSGNVLEWCWDWYGSYSSEAQTNPTGGDPSLAGRIQRGGGYPDSAEFVRSVSRNGYSPGYWANLVGFRLVRPSDPVEVEMVWVPGGSFQMGNPDTSIFLSDGERPVHTVTLSSFYMGKYEVTQEQYEAVMGNNPSYYFSGNNLPVESVSWYDALVFCNKLSMTEGLTPAYRINNSTDPAAWGSVPTSDNSTWDAVTIDSGSMGYRLPTEAQWEYAAKGGNGSPGNYTYAGSNNPDEVAWYNNSDTSRAVGTLAPNGLGLYDMSGNVSEWCWDWGADYSSASQTDPTGASSGSYRMGRGGGWVNNLAEYVRSACRGGSNPYYRNGSRGFRLVRP